MSVLSIPTFYWSRAADSHATRAADSGDLTVVGGEPCNSTTRPGTHDRIPARWCSYQNHPSKRTPRPLQFKYRIAFLVLLLLTLLSFLL